MTRTKDHERDNHLTTGGRMRIAAAMLVLGWVALTACG